MIRTLAFVSIAAVSTAGASAQCLAAPSGTSILPGFVKWNSTAGYTSAFVVQDEGLTNPPIALTAIPNFPMAGAVGNLDQLWVNSNGEVYLTDSTLALAQPANGILYGATSLDEMRGSVAGASARVVALGGDNSSSSVAGAVWDIAVDQTVPGEVRIIWTDMARLANTTDRFSFDCTLYSSGAVRYSYSSGVPAAARYVGISIGNAVGSASSPSRDLTSGTADSGTEGLLFESFTATSWDLAGKAILILPNGNGGYLSALTCEPAFHAAYGTGCYNIPLNNDSVYQHWTSSAAAATTLNGNTMTLLPTGNGYAIAWGAGLAGAAYVTPTGSATALATTDDGSHTIAPTTPFPSPFGAATQITISHNGIVTLGATSNNAGDWSPTGTEFLASTGTGYYSWYDYNDTEAGSTGRIKYEEIGTILYITWDGVEGYQSGVNPFTFQYQMDLSSGIVTLVWTAVNPVGLAGREYLVGYTDAGPSTSLGAVDLPTALPIVTTSDISPLALSASPAPVFTLGGPTVPITYTIDNVIDVVPPFGIGIPLLLFSFVPIPGGIDAGFIDMPGCNFYIATADIILIPSGTAPTSTLTLAIPQPLFPGLSFFSQAVSLFTPNSLPNGQNAFGGVLSNGLQSSFQLQ